MKAPPQPRFSKMPRSPTPSPCEPSSPLPQCSGGLRTAWLPSAALTSLSMSGPFVTTTTTNVWKRYENFVEFLRTLISSLRHLVLPSPSLPFSARPTPFSFVISYKPPQRISPLLSSIPIPASEFSLKFYKIRPKKK